MKCWECKRQIVSGERVSRICYTDGVTDRFRDVCRNCEPLLKLTPAHFAEVPRITQRQGGKAWCKQQSEKADTTT